MPAVRSVLAAFGLLGSCLLTAGCDRKPSAPPPAPPSQEDAAADAGAEPSALPAPPLAAGAPKLDDRMIAENNRGVGLMGQFEYDQAYDIFFALAQAQPAWIDVHVNLAIAALNRRDLKYPPQAVKILQGVLKRSPKNLRAQYCLGVLHYNSGELEEARRLFEQVAQADPRDGYAAYYAGQCWNQLRQPAQALPWFRRATAADPMLVSGFLGLSVTLRQLGKDDEAQEPFRTFERLQSNPQKRAADIKYTLMGPKALAETIDLASPLPAPAPAGPLFAAAAALEVKLPAGHAWAKAGQAERPTVTVCDLNGDGRLDLFLSGALAAGQNERKHAVLLARDGGYELAVDHSLAAIDQVNAVLWGDYDNDGLTDAYFCRRGANQLWQQKPAGQWTDVTAATQTGGGVSNTVDGALVDADHDGDLDLLLVNADGPNELLANTVTGPFKPLAQERGLAGRGKPGRSVLVADLDRDRDADLVVLYADGAHEVLINDRLWNYHPGKGWDEFCQSPAVAAVAFDADADGQVELYTLSADGLKVWTPDERDQWRGKPLIAGPLELPPGAQLAVADLDGDGRPEAIYSTADGWRAVSLDRPARDRFAAQRAELAAWSLWLDDAARGPAVVGLAPEGVVAWRPGPGRFGFLTLELSGKHDANKQMRSNSSGIGVRAAARFGSRWTATHTYREQSGPGQSLQPRALGLAGAKQADFLELHWPDGAYESELALAAGQRHKIDELNRIPTSCPILFAWNGRRYAFITDCLAVGGLGFATGPGTYAPVVPRESVLLPEGSLAQRGGALQLKLHEPAEEITYLDAARLAAYDLPPGWQLTVDERLAVAGPPASGAALAFRRLQSPHRATDAAGRDVTGALRAADRLPVEPGEADSHFLGRTAEHLLTLEFAEPLAGPGEPLLVIDGWVEFPYSQTMFAAWQAGARYEAPTLEARDSGGRWHVVAKEFGYPGGMPRHLSLPIDRGKLPAGCRALRLRSNLEVYWDRVAVAWAEPDAPLRRHDLPLTTAALRQVGFPRRSLGPQRQPDFDYARRAPIEDVRFPAGYYTAVGDVSELVSRRDDASAVFGPGEEVHLEFSAAPEPPAGWTRRYVLEVAGWCKDMDLFTKDGETVEPLPARAESGAAELLRRGALDRRYRTRYEAGK